MERLKVDKSKSSELHSRALYIVAMDMCKYIQSNQTDKYMHTHTNTDTRTRHTHLYMYRTWSGIHALLSPHHTHSIGL